MLLMGIGIVLLTIGASAANSDNILIPFAIAMAGALCMFFGQNFVELDEEEETYGDNGECQ